MKKSFLKTFIVLSLLSIFFCGSFKNVNAVEQFPIGSGSTAGTGASVSPSTTEQVPPGGWPTVRGTGAGGNVPGSLAEEWFKSTGTNDPGAPGKPGDYRPAPAQSAAALKLAQERANLVESACGITSAAGWGACFKEMFGYGIVAASKGTGWIAQLAGWIFDKVILETTRYPVWAGSGSGDMLYMTWKIVRDFSNLILVFSLLYLGIKTILQGQGFADKKVLAGIIIAAVLINFSFIFTKDIVFGVSNTVGLQILKSVNPNGPAAPGPLVAGQPSSSYSAGIMGFIQPQQLLSEVVGAAAESGWTAIYAFAGKVILFSVISLMLALVFFCVSIIFIYRFCIFIILIIASPIGFVSAYIPWMNAQGKQWWSQLKQQAIFFPAFSLALYVVLSICTTISRYEVAPLVAGDGGASIFGFIFRFLLIMAFMIGLMILPGKMGVAGATMMTSVGNNITKRIKNAPRRSMQYAGQAAASTTARGGRLVGGGLLANTIGGKELSAERRRVLDDKVKSGGVLGFRESRQIKADDKIKSLRLTATTNMGIDGSIARQKLRTAEGLRNQSYDLRNTKSGSKLGIGKGIESYNGAVASRVKQLKDQREKDEKILGFNGSGLTQAQKDANKIALSDAEAERDVHADIVSKKHEEAKKAREVFEKSAKSTADKAVLDAILEQEIKAQKALSEKELKVGEAKNPLISAYKNLATARSKRFRDIFSTGESEAIEQMNAEINKRLREEGKAKPSKKKTTSSGPTVTTSGTGATPGTTTSTSGGGTTSGGTTTSSSGTSTPPPLPTT